MDKVISYIEQFDEERDWKQFHTLENLAKSTVLEANELLEHFQFDPNGDGDEEGINDEIADIMVYCLQLCIVRKIDPIENIYRKMEKNAKKYPIEKAKGNAKKYTEL